MLRIYTDPRFPTAEVLNDGSCLFTVRTSNLPTVTFTGVETVGSGQVSESFASRRAERYFDHLYATFNEEDRTKLIKPSITESPVKMEEVEQAMWAAKAATDPTKKSALELQALKLAVREESVAQRLAASLLED